MHRPNRLPHLAAPIAALLFLLAPVATATQAHKELGRMWTLDEIPAAFFQEAYGFVPDQPWLDHARLSTLRFGGGCSASFVSPRGLILTNHHCARDFVAELSSGEASLLDEGFAARTLAEELPCPGLSVQQLVAFGDVSAEMEAGVTLDMDPAAARARREENRKAILERAQAANPGLEARLVPLYQGSRHHLYLYRSWTDVRLAAVPHVQSAHFGGDPDNFTYPRFALDFALCRAYEDGKPADTSAHYLRWKTAGPQDGQVVFVVGNPGSTGRLMTLAQMEYLRDVEFPRRLAGLHRMLERLAEQAGDDPERAAATRAQILDLENARKAFEGYFDGLRNPAVMERKRAAEEEIRRRVAADPQLAARFGDAWSRIEEIVAQKREVAAAGGTQERMQELRQAEQEQARRVGEAYFAVYGTDIPPDATGTLRISDGVVRGFPYNGTVAPWYTSLYGLFARNVEFGDRPPFDLPRVWLDRRHELDLRTPVNFVSSCDIIGGNSGSPVIDRDGELVGLVFDGNIEMLANLYVYTDEVARSVSVHPAFIIEALRKIYDAPDLADELEGSSVGYR